MRHVVSRVCVWRCGWTVAAADIQGVASGLAECSSSLLLPLRCGLLRGLCRVGRRCALGVLACCSIQHFMRVLSTCACSNRMVVRAGKGMLQQACPAPYPCSKVQRWLAGYDAGSTAFQLRSSCVCEPPHVTCVGSPFDEQRMRLLPWDPIVTHASTSKCKRSRLAGRTCTCTSTQARGAVAFSLCILSHAAECAVCGITLGSCLCPRWHRSPRITHEVEKVCNSHALSWM